MVLSKPCLHKDSQVYQTGKRLLKYLSTSDMSSTETHYKILVISDYRSVGSSRPEAEIFVRLAQQGHVIHILSYPEANYYNDRFESYGIKVIQNHPTRKNSIPYIRYLRKLVLENKYDFVHAFNSQGLTNAVWALRGLKTKLITYRGYAGQTHWYDPMMYLKYFHPRVDHIICVSHDIENILSKNFIGGRKKLSTIPKGHDPAWYENIQPVDRKSFGCSNDDILVSFVANNRPFKGLNYLLEAISLLPSDLPLHLLFIGNGYDVKDIQFQLAGSPYKDKLHILGYRTDAISVVAASDCLILTSTHGEGLAKSVVEAMSVGIAPIITAIPGNEGLVVDGESGWIIPIKNPKAIAEALLDMASDKDERLRRGKNALAHIRKHFHIEKTVEKFLALYRQLLVS